MARSLDLPVLITVPGLDTQSAVALGNELLAAAESIKLPPPIEKARHKLRHAVQVLQSGDTGEDLSRFIVTLRPYVLRTLAHADDEHPETEELVATLLSPLLRWMPRPLRSSNGSPGSPGSSDPGR
jgi:hypothetical protein